LYFILPPSSLLFFSLARPCPTRIECAGHSVVVNPFGAKGLLSARALRVESTRIMAEPIPQGTTIGRYIVERPLGAGGMGEVYLAQDIKLNRAVALKLLPAELSNERERLRRFEQEACAASALNHPNILTIYEIN